MHAFWIRYTLSIRCHLRFECFSVSHQSPGQQQGGRLRGARECAAPLAHTYMFRLGMRFGYGYFLMRRGKEFAVCSFTLQVM